MRSNLACDKPSFFKKVINLSLTPCVIIQCNFCVKIIRNLSAKFFEYYRDFSIFAV